MCIMPLCGKGLISVYSSVLFGYRVLAKICAMHILVTFSMYSHKAAFFGTGVLYQLPE